MTNIYLGINKKGIIHFSDLNKSMKFFIENKFNSSSKKCIWNIFSLFDKSNINDIYVFYFDIPLNSNNDNDNEIYKLFSKHKMVYVSEIMKFVDRDETFRLLKYTKGSNKNYADKNYLSMCKDILERGNIKDDRTGTGTFSLFGKTLRFDLSNDKIPILTTKRVPFKTCLKELLWFLRGDTDNKILQKEGVHIWDKNSSREFLDSRNLNYPEGVVGPLYGWSMRHFGKEYNPKLANSTNNCEEIYNEGGFDQLEYIVKELKENPHSRRILMSYWNPCVLDNIPISWCHVLVQFYVEEIDKIKYLSCQFYQRSQDVFLGGPFNILSYSILTHLIAKKTGMVAKELIMNIGDAHIYKNHSRQVLEQLKRTGRISAHILISDNVIKKDWSQLTVSDFNIIGYYPHDAIKGEMSA